MESAARQVQPSVSLRQGTEADHPLVYDSWSKHYRRHGLEAKRVPEQVYRVEQRELIREILARGLLTVAVIDDLLAGYVVSSDNAVHWLHVKAVFRGMGIAHALAHSLPAVYWYTHDVPHAAALWGHLGLPLRYNPHRVRAV